MNNILSVILLMKQVQFERPKNVSKKEPCRMCVSVIPQTYIEMRDEKKNERKKCIHMYYYI